MFTRIVLPALIIFAFCAQIYAADITVTVVGEAQIVSGDLSTAKIVAEQRAKWSAMEEAAQVKVTAANVVHNAEILDEVVKSEVSGSIKLFKKLDEGKDGNIYWIKAQVTVRPDEAQNVLAGMAKNTIIAVYFPLYFPKKRGVEESHGFSEALIDELLALGFEVVDLADISDAGFRGTLLNAALKKDMGTVRTLASRYMAGSTLVGKLDIIDKGNDIGYGKINFSIVDGSLDYRLIGEKGGKKSILASGTMLGRGQGATGEQAAYNTAQDMGERYASQLAGIAGEKILGDNKRTIRVVLISNNDIAKLREFKEVVQNISWVLNVKENGIDSLTLTYPEKAMYLASIININGGYKIKSFTDTEILVYSK
ncbi:MAG: hypothetical protein LBD73_05320 [Deferribacteraceae bacterium]|nr:hypothetical protein [Deferribacteraceae bacterium]